MKKSGWKIILGVAVLVCVICLGRFGWVKYQDYKTEQARKATLKEIASTEFTGENEGKEPEKVPAGVKHGQKINFKKLKTFNFKNKKKFENYLRNVKNIRDMGSHVRKDQEVTSNDKIITLSTCVGGQPNNRYLVQAVLTDERSTK